MDKYCRSEIKDSFLKADASARLGFLLLEKLLYHSMNLTVAQDKLSTQKLTIKPLNPCLCNKNKISNADFSLPGCRNLNFVSLYLYIISLYSDTNKHLLNSRVKEVLG